MGNDFRGVCQRNRDVTVPPPQVPALLCAATFLYLPSPRQTRSSKQLLPLGKGNCNQTGILIFPFLPPIFQALLESKCGREIVPEIVKTISTAFVPAPPPGLPQPQPLNASPSGRHSPQEPGWLLTALVKWEEQSLWSKSRNRHGKVFSSWPDSMDQVNQMPTQLSHSSNSSLDP